jgi:hypothetical protein
MNLVAVAMAMLAAKSALAPWSPNCFELKRSVANREAVPQSRASCRLPYDGAGDELRWNLISINAISTHSRPYLD